MGKDPGRRSTWATLLAAIALAHHELSVSAKQRIGRNQCRDQRESSTSYSLCSPGQAPALYVGESNTSPAQLLAKDAVLLLELFDDLLLATIHPASEHQQQEMQRERTHQPGLAPARGRVPADGAILSFT